MSSFLGKDGRYDLPVVLGYTDAPPIAGMAAPLLHLHTENTKFAGCVAVQEDHMIEIRPFQRWHDPSYHPSAASQPVAQ